MRNNFVKLSDLAVDELVKVFKNSYKNLEVYDWFLEELIEKNIANVEDYIYNIDGLEVLSLVFGSIYTTDMQFKITDERAFIKSIQDTNIYNETTWNLINEMDMLLQTDDYDEDYLCNLKSRIEYLLEREIDEETIMDSMSMSDVLEYESDDFEMFVDDYDLYVNEKDGMIYRLDEIEDELEED